jgi:hypothetical protein
MQTNGDTLSPTQERIKFFVWFGCWTLYGWNMVITLMAMCWYWLEIYTPQIGYYCSYGPAIALGGVMNMVFRDEYDWWTVMCVGLGGFFGIFLSSIGMAQITSQTSYSVFFDSSWYVFSGSPEYITQNRNTVTEDSYFLFEVSVIALSFILSFGMWALGAWLFLSNQELYRMVELHGTDRIGMTSMVLVMILGGVQLIGGSVMGLWKLVPVSLYSNVLAWPYVLLTMRPFPYVKLAREIDSRLFKEQKYAYQFIFWYIGLIVGMGFVAVALITTPIWRQESVDGATFCPNRTQLIGQTYVFFGDQHNITFYTTTTSYADKVSSFTCLDDVMIWSIGAALFILIWVSTLQLFKGEKGFDYGASMRPSPVVYYALPVVQQQQQDYPQGGPMPLQPIAVAAAPLSRPG